MLRKQPILMEIQGTGTQWRIVHNSSEAHLMDLLDMKLGVSICVVLLP